MAEGQVCTWGCPAQTEWSKCYESYESELFHAVETCVGFVSGSVTSFAKLVPCQNVPAGVQGPVIAVVSVFL